MKVNKSKFAILGILSLEPMSGYDIRKIFLKSVGNFWNESYGQIYPLLKSLLQNGFVVKSVENQAGKPNRHVYALTDKGRDVLRSWLIEPVKPQTGRIEILLKLFFGSQVDVDDNIKQVEHYRDAMSRELQELMILEKHVKTKKAGNPNVPYSLLTVNYGKHFLRMVVQWCDETLSTLRKMNEKTGETHSKKKSNKKKYGKPK